MRIVVIGATGRLGSAVVAAARAAGHEIVEVSRRSGVDAYTSRGLAEAMAGAEALVDAGSMNDPDPDKVLDFFTTTTRNLTNMAREAGVKHYVAIGIVGTDEMQDSAYFCGKLAQEHRVAAGGVPYTIVRLTQFYEFMDTIAQTFGDGDPLRVTDAEMQPLAVADAGRAVADVAADAPANSIREAGGPEAAPIADFITKALAAKGDGRAVVADADVGYFGGRPRRATLVTGSDARRMPTRFDEWLAAHTDAG